MENGEVERRSEVTKMTECQDVLGGDTNPPVSQCSSTLNVQKESLDGLLKRGEEILDTFTQSVRGFEAQSLQIRELAKEMASIKSQLKRKGSSDCDTSDVVPKKTSRVEISDSESEVDDIDAILISDKSEEPCSPLEDCMAEFNSFFVEELKCGDGIKEEVAKIMNKSLRCPPDANKLQALIERNKRLENVTNLQVPRVDSFLWGQLKGGTKSLDVAKQKTISALNQALVPLIRALDHIAGNSSPDVVPLKNYIGDSVKLMCREVHKINMQRRDTIRKELFPKFKTLCSEYQPISADFSHRVIWR